MFCRRFSSFSLPLYKTVCLRVHHITALSRTLGSESDASIQKQVVLERRLYQTHAPKKRTGRMPCAYKDIASDASWGNWWNNLLERMFKFHGCPVHSNLKIISIGTRICCQLRDFKFRCSSRSHKRSKFNSKCSPTFSPPCAWTSAGGYIDSLKMCSCPINPFLIPGITCVTSTTA